MKKIFMAAGAFALTAASVVIVRANTHRSTPTEIYYSVGGALPCNVLQSASINTNFTTTGTANQVNFKTISGASVHLWAGSACNTKPVYFK